MRYRILLVEGNADKQAIYRIILEHSGFEACDGKQHFGSLATSMQMWS